MKFNFTVLITFYSKLYRKSYINTEILKMNSLSLDPGADACISKGSIDLSGFWKISENIRPEKI